MKLSLNTGIAIIIILGGLYIIFKDDETPQSIDEQLAQMNESLDSQLPSSGDPLNNTNSTLKTLVARDSQTKLKVSALEDKVEELKSEIQNKKHQSNDNALDLRYSLLETRYEDLYSQIQTLKSKESQPPAFIDGDIKPTDITPIDSNNERVDTAPIGKTGNVILDQFIQPANEVTGYGSVDANVQPIGSQSNNNIVWIQQDDLIQVTNDDGSVVASFPDTNKRKDANDEPNTISNNLGLNTGLGEDNKITSVPIYTVPANSTFFGSVSMSAILGRVPINNQLTNPFRFKVLVGGQNLATNGLYIPNLDSMVVSGDAEGDFTLECARGDIDQVTFTFMDGTVRVIDAKESDSGTLGYISDKDGVPCISGQYITNFPDYITKQGGLTALSSFASSLAQSAVTTSTNTDGVTVSVVNDSAQKALGDGFESGASEITKWYAERQQNAFDVVYVSTGNELVINIEKTLKIDYELDGRKLYHQDNAQEYLQW
ncbi:TIGR03752 family integrating conjugative element protein [Vibrio sp. 1180_3]|uniref:TIGR03752 family integrating conjugative element protein n=1 Tax=Vibrio sp. 1180_3 TaxID=2528832 RepID=UPI002405EDB1|nr:TIGR03752 family integrating conjugative element protein [Vibrio sp. 1180_3]MDF9399126.1 TIGR03752 family integrating conjugative element protein [Vibrio sp. 1180_3]